MRAGGPHARVSPGDSCADAREQQLAQFKRTLREAFPALHFVLEKIAGMNLVEILSEQSRKRPKATAIIETRRGRNRLTTFAELEERSAKVARLLRNSGIQAGDPVLIFHSMSSELYVVLLGVFRIGATAMFLDPSAGRAHIERCCELQAPKALVASPKAHLLRITSGALRRIPRKFVVGAWVPGATP